VIKNKVRKAQTIKVYILIRHVISVYKYEQNSLMSILQSILNAPKPMVAIDPLRVTEGFRPIHHSVVDYLERFVPSLLWEAGDLKVTLVELADIASTYKREALFYGFGPSDAKAGVMAVIDSGLARLASACALTGNEQPNLEDLQSIPLSRLDLFLMSPLIDVMALTSSRLPQSGGAGNWNTLHRTESLSIGRYIFPSQIKDWAQVSFTCVGKPLPQEDKEEPVTDKPAGKKAAKRKSKTTAKPKKVEAWPVQYSTHLLIPRSMLDSILANVTMTGANDKPIQKERLRESWLHRIDPTQTRLRSVLETFQMSVAECTRLEVGQLLPLPGVTLSNINIEAEFGDERQTIVTGALGIHKSHKAIRLNSCLSPLFLKDLDVLINTI
jgi:hypothetical protein